MESNGSKLEDQIKYIKKSYYPKEIKKLIKNDEIIYYCENISKVNDFYISQERKIVLTDKALYNLKQGLFSSDYSLQRTILYKYLKGISYCENSTEFIIHGEFNEYDYYYKSQDKMRIIYLIAFFYEINTKKPLKICKIIEKGLKNYVTSKKDKKENMNFSRMDEKFLEKTLIYNKLSFIQRKKDEKEIQEETDQNMKYIEKLIKKDYTLINRICFYCLRDKNNNDPKIDEEASKNQESLIDLHQEEFINDIDEFKFNCLKDYLKQTECPHFFHDECKELIKKKHKLNYEDYFECFLCKDLLTTKTLYLFDIDISDFKDIHLYYIGLNNNDNIKYHYCNFYIYNKFKNNYLPLIYSSEIKYKFQNAIELFQKFRYNFRTYNHEYFDIGINEIPYYEKLYNREEYQKQKNEEERQREKEEEEREKEEERERERERRRERERQRQREESDDDDYHYYNNNRRNDEDRKGNEKVQLNVCFKCKEICIFCGGNIKAINISENQKFWSNGTAVRAHRKCIPNNINRKCCMCGSSSISKLAHNACYRCLRKGKISGSEKLSKCYYCKNK